MPFKYEQRTIIQGSRLFSYAVPLVAATKTYWYDIYSIFGADADLFDYFDSLNISNNSALPVHFYLDSKDNDYYILAYGIQPVTRRPFRRFGFYNPDAANDIAADLIQMSMRRLPPDIMPVVNTQ